jgi:hypothetical protein
MSHAERAYLVVGLEPVNCLMALLEHGAACQDSRLGTGWCSNRDADAVCVCRTPCCGIDQMALAFPVALSEAQIVS